MVSLLFGVWVVSMLSLAGYKWTIPFFGVILNGMAGAVVALIGMVAFGYISWGLYKLDIKAWWCAILVTVLWAVSAGLTFSRVNMLELYEKMGFPEQQLEVIEQSGIPDGSTIALSFGLFVAIFLVYCLYIKKYFSAPSAQESLS